MRMTTANPCDYCEHADWQHAREGDARLETEDFVVGQCYVNGCDCDEFQLVKQTRDEFEKRGRMCSGSEEKVDGLILIQSISKPETMYALVSPELAPQLLEALNAQTAKGD